MAEKKKLSIAEILAAARKQDGGESDTPPAEPASSDPPAAKPGSEAAPKVPAEKASSPKLKPGERPSVADILAMARSGAKDAEPAAAAAAEVEPKAKPKPAAKAKPAAANAPPAERMDTASILAAARTATKRGPVSKAESPDLARSKAKSAKAGKAKGPKLAAPVMPVKPAYAKPRPAKAKPDADEGRRSFLSGMAVMGTTFGLWTLAMARFMFPNILTEPPSKFKVGFPANFPPGEVVTKFKAQFGVWVVNGEYEGRSEIYALSTVCTHLGCTPNWLDGEQKFKCPCHGSGFYKDGVNFEGPAPRPLERYAIRVADDGQVEIDKSKKYQEELGQWNEQSSFIPV